MFSRGLLLFAGICGLVSCANRPGSDFVPLHGAGIVGGQTLPPTHPLARRIHRLERLNFVKPTETARPDRCTASLISRRVMLTAKHCLPSLKVKSSLTAVFTMNDGVEIPVRVQDWEAHPDEDLALIRLASEAPESAEVLPLPEAHENYAAQFVEAAGYGRLSGRKEDLDTDGVLRQATLTIFRYHPEEPHFKVDQTQGLGICHGDSGGAGLFEFGGQSLILGVAIQGYGGKSDDRCRGVGEYVNVQVYRDWVESQLSILELRSLNLTH